MASVGDFLQDFGQGFTEIPKDILGKQPKLGKGQKPLPFERGTTTIGELWIHHGGPRNVAHTMDNIANAESSCDNKQKNDTPCAPGMNACCALQICSEPELCKKMQDDVNECVKHGIQKYKSQGLGAWAASRSAWAGKPHKACKVNAGRTAIGSATHAVGDAADTVGSALGKIAAFFVALGKAETWLRIGKVVLGAIMVLVALNMLTRGALGSVAKGMKP